MTTGRAAIGMAMLMLAALVGTAHCGARSFPDFEDDPFDVFREDDLIALGHHRAAAAAAAAEAEKRPGYGDETDPYGPYYDEGDDQAASTASFERRGGGVEPPVEDTDEDPYGPLLREPEGRTTSPSPVDEASTKEDDGPVTTSPSPVDEATTKEDDGPVSLESDMFRGWISPEVMKGVKRVFLFSDLHGDLKALEAILAMLEAENDTGDDAGFAANENLIVSTGDFMDRGPDDDTIQSMLEGLREEGYKIVFVVGNHEQMISNGDWRYRNMQNVCHPCITETGGSFSADNECLKVKLREDKLDKLSCGGHYNTFVRETMTAVAGLSHPAHNSPVLVSHGGISDNVLSKAFDYCEKNGERRSLACAIDSLAERFQVAAGKVCEQFQPKSANIEAFSPECNFGLGGKREQITISTGRWHTESRTALFYHNINRFVKDVAGPDMSKWSPQHRSIVEKMNTSPTSIDDEWMKGEDGFCDPHERRCTSPAWDRSVYSNTFAQNQPKRKACEAGMKWKHVIESNDKSVGLVRQAVGHSPDDSPVRSACGGRLIAMDTAMSRGVCMLQPQFEETKKPCPYSMVVLENFGTPEWETNPIIVRKEIFLPSYDFSALHAPLPITCDRLNIYGDYKKPRSYGIQQPASADMWYPVKCPTESNHDGTTTIDVDWGGNLRTYQ